jgi:hypothetical protein
MRGDIMEQKKIYEIIKTCDVIVIKGDWYNPLEAGIMLVSKSKYVHCMTVINQCGLVDEAILKGVIINYLSAHEGKDCVVMRYKNPIDEAKLLKYLAETRAKSKGYDLLAYIGFLTNIQKLQDEDKWYCSERPYWMFQDNGYKLTEKDIHLIFPAFFVQDEVHFERVWEGTI